VEESIRMTEDRDKWRKYVHGVANPRSRTAKNRPEHSSPTDTQIDRHSTYVAIDCILNYALRCDLTIIIEFVYCHNF